MPRYFFNLFDHVREPDDIGIELPDVTAARIEAIRFAGEVVRDDAGLLDDGVTLKVQVTDEGGRECLRIEVRAVDPAN